MRCHANAKYRWYKRWHFAVHLSVDSVVRIVFKCMVCLGISSSWPCLFLHNIMSLYIALLGQYYTQVGTGVCPVWGVLGPIGSRCSSTNYDSLQKDLIVEHDVNERSSHHNSLQVSISWKGDFLRGMMQLTPYILSSCCALRLSYPSRYGFVRCDGWIDRFFLSHFLAIFFSLYT